MRRCGILACLMLASACNARPSNAEDAYLALAEACRKDAAGALFEALDTPTRESIASVHQSQRAMRQLIEERYPPGERERALGKIPTTAFEETKASIYFQRLEGTGGLIASLRHRVEVGRGAPKGSLRGDGTAEVWREGGSVLHFAPDAKGRWGFSELRDQWEQAKVRSFHDLQTVRDNIRLFERAAGHRQAAEEG